MAPLACLCKTKLVTVKLTLCLPKWQFRIHLSPNEFVNYDDIRGLYAWNFVNLAINRKINVQKGGDIYYSGSIYLDEYGVFILHKIMYSVTFSCTHCSSGLVCQFSFGCMLHKFPRREIVILVSLMFGQIWYVSQISSINQIACCHFSQSPMRTDRCDMVILKWQIHLSMNRNKTTVFLQL